MFDELILVAEATIIENTVIVDHDRIINAAAARQPSGTHVLKLMHKSEGSCPTDFSHEGLSTDVQSGSPRLFLENRVVKIDSKGDLEAVIGPQGRDFVSVTHRDLVGYANKLFGRGLFLNAGALQ